MPDTQWVVLELGPKAEGEDPDLVKAAIRHSIKGAEVFIPASVTKMGDERVIQYLVEGYAFVRRDHPDSSYLRLEGTRYVQGVLRQTSGTSARTSRVLAVVGDDEINKLRGQIREEVDQGIAVGDLVLITSGAYRQITARVETEIPEHDAVQVFVKLRSKEAIVTLPRACLRLVQKAQRSPFLDRLQALGGWLEGAQHLLGWPGDVPTRFLVPYQTFVQLSDWLIRGRQAKSFVAAVEGGLSLDVATLRQQSATHQQLSKWVGTGPPLLQGLRSFDIPLPMLRPILERSLEWDRLSRLVARGNEGKMLYRAVTSAYSDLPFPALDARYLDWLWFHDVFERIDAVRLDVEGIEAVLRSGGKGMIQNLIIDGTQLAIRCALAPGLGELKDSKGRPTGAILGFCQSLVSLRKKHPGAAVYVTWDGSSQRRRAKFAGYKQSRSTRSPMATFEIQALRGILPKLGVFQAFNPEEEADDVIATLVRKRLRGKINAFLSTDRDLLQLVTLTDHQLVPAVGAGKEKLYTVEAVVQEYGVDPGNVVQVRAITGDSSDEIPGAAGIGLKTAGKLVKMYGSVERLFASNFAGLTPKQYDNLRSAEQQIKLNLELLTLQDDLPLTLVGPDPDQIAASERLREMDLKPEAILAAFFPHASGTSAHP